MSLPGPEEFDFTEQFRGLAVADRLALYRPLRPDGVKQTRDGREICDRGYRAGDVEYRHRLVFVFQVYDCVCQLCGFSVSWSECTADHITPRGSGGAWREDNVLNLWPAHGICNTRRGSRRIMPGRSCAYCKYKVVVGLIHCECFHCGSRW